MPAFSRFTLPFLLEDQYLLTSILKEKSESIIYAATQMDVRREVVIETLHPELLSRPDRVDYFLQSARAQARLDSKLVAAALQLFYAAGTWHVVRERMSGETLESLAAAGRKFPAVEVIELLLHLCRGCLYMDIESIASQPFSPEHIYLTDNGFRFANRACAGPRQRDTSHRVLCAAEKHISPMLDPHDRHAGLLADLLARMGCEGNWDTLGVVRFAEELTRLHVRVTEVGA